MTAAQYFNYTVYRTMDMDNEYPTKNKQKKLLDEKLLTHKNARYFWLHQTK